MTVLKQSPFWQTWLEKCEATKQLSMVIMQEFKAGIKARGFLRRGEDAYFDVSFANVNAEPTKMIIQLPPLLRDKRAKIEST